MDQFWALFNQVTPTARAFFSGNLCQLTNFDDPERLGYVHILRAGRLRVDRPGVASVTLCEPSLLFATRHAPHSFVPDSDSGVDLVCATVELGGNQGSPVAQSLPAMMIVPIAQVETMAPTLDLLMSEAFDARDGRQFALDRLFEYLIVQLLRYAVAVGQVEGGVLAGLTDPRLARALAAMHDAPGKPWTLDDLADCAGMSRTRFAVLFRTVIGTTPIDYLMRWRMMIAQNMLRQGKSVKAVAAAVGYESPAALSRSFAKIVGLSPRAWSAIGSGEGVAE